MKRGPYVWTPALIEAVLECIKRFGVKWAAAMLGIRPASLRQSLRNHGVYLRGPRA